MLEYFYIYYSQLSNTYIIRPAKEFVTSWVTSYTVRGAIYSGPMKWPTSMLDGSTVGPRTFTTS
jgi:hypothetical protein